MARDEWRKPNNDVNYKEEGYGPVELSTMSMELAARNTENPAIEVGNSATREVNGRDLMEGKVARISVQTTDGRDHGDD